MELVRAAGLPRAHVFPFSARPGTEAAAMPGAVPPEVKRRRFREMQHVARASAEAFRRSMIGRTLHVLWERRGSDGVASGLSDNYLRVETGSPDAEPNTISGVHIEAVKGEALTGRITASTSPRRGRPSPRPGG